MPGLGLGLGRGKTGSFVQSLVLRDAIAYRDLLIANGGTDLTGTEEFDALVQFTEELYDQFGRMDFWLLSSDYNMGTGVIVRSFHGSIGTLVNGPTWSADRIVFGGSKYLFVEDFFVSQPALQTASGWLAVGTPPSGVNSRAAVSTDNSFQFGFGLFSAALLVNTNATPSLSDAVVVTGDVQSMAYVGMDSSGVDVAVEGSAFTQTVYSSFAPFTGDDLLIGGTGTDVMTDMSFFAPFASRITHAQYLAVRAAYLATIGA